MDESGTDLRVQRLAQRITAFFTAHSLLPPNNNAELLINKLKGLVTNIKWSPEEATDLFNALLKRFESATNDRSHLLSWTMTILHSIEINYITPSWRSQKGKTLIKLVQDKHVTDEELKNCLASNTEKTLEEILEEIRQQKLNQIDDKLLDEVKDIVSSVCNHLKSKNDGSQLTGLKERDLLKLCQAAEKTHFRPRLTQMVSWCLMALSKTGRLIQVGTGEGKTCIVAMFAAFRAMRGEQVDIMSSSPVLAERDMEEWKDFYKVLNISVDCNNNKQGQDLKKCYERQVVYGTVKEFAGDWLKQHFHRMDIFGQRKFQCAIVDEVDSLMLDKGLHVVYISSDMPALQHLSPLLACIWATANQYSEIGTETTVGPKYPFHQVMLENITKGRDIDEFTILQMAEDTGTLAKGSVRDLKRDKSLLIEKTASITVNQLEGFFKTIERKFPSCQFVLHCINKDGAIEKLNKELQSENGKRVPLLLTNGGFCQYMYSDEDGVHRAAEQEIKRALHFTPCELSKDQSSCYIPGFLSDLVKTKLKVWIENAFYAKTMTEDHEYIIEKHGIVPVDYTCTGVVENFMKWTDGLQQFLEMKHESKLSDMTAITNYMSNVGLLLKYRDQIYGISGTLGQQAETETLEKIYNGIQTCQIPTFKPRKLFEVEGVIVDDEKEWIEKICNAVTAQTNPTLYREGRAVLIICETIKRAKVLYDTLKVCNKTLYINNNMDNTAIFTKKLKAGEVIIATNLAGRGTDLKVSDEVNRAGGLFVVQTFLPKNARVEAQAFGRTARQGSPGSAQLIVCSSHLSGLLQKMVLTKKLQSLFEKLTDATPVYQDLFVMQLRLYQENHSNVTSQDMSQTLSRILTKNSVRKSRITTAKKVRDNLVAQRLASFLECDIPKIKKEEELFSQYLDTLDEVYKSSNKPADSDLSALNEFWGMWLLTKFSEKDSITELKEKLSRDLNDARQKLRHRESPLSNLHDYTAFGNELREKGHLVERIKMYTKAIQKDHCWAAIAYYNRAFASLALDRHQDPCCINQALNDLQKAIQSVELYCEQIKYCTQQFKKPCGDSINRFDKQMIVRSTVLLLFKNNISEAIEKLERARDFCENVNMEEKLIYFLVPVSHFFSLLINPQFLRDIMSLSLFRHRDPLRVLQLINDPSSDILRELMGLKSLGLTHVYTLNTRRTWCSLFRRMRGALHQALDRLTKVKWFFK